MKVLVNRCFGGFGLSTEAHEWLIKHKGWKVTQYGEDGKIIDQNCELVEDPTPWSGNTFSKYRETPKVEGGWGDDEREYPLRINQDVIECVETLGTKLASSKLAEIDIADVPDDVKWEIDNYDGSETIREKGRSW